MLLPILVSILLGLAITLIIFYLSIHHKISKDPFILSPVSSILIGSTTGLVMSKDITTIIFCALAGVGGWFIFLTAIFFKMIYLLKDFNEFDDQY